MEIYLDGQRYVLKPKTKVLRSPIIEYTQNIRTVGQQKREDRSGISSWAIEEWGEGFGVSRMNVNNDRDVQSFWDCENVDTRYPSQLVLSPKFISTPLTPSMNPDAFIAFGVIQNNVLALSYLNYSYLFYSGSNTIASLTIIGANIRSDFITEGSYGYILGVVPSSSYWTDYVQILNTSGQNASVFRVGTPYYGLLGADFAGLPASSEDETYWLTYNKKVFRMTGFAVGTNALTINDTVLGSYPPDLQNYGGNVYAKSAYGLYSIVPSVSAVKKGSFEDKSLLQSQFNDEIVYRAGYDLLSTNGDNAPAPIGFNLDDGLPADKAGKITAMLSTPSWLYCAVEGATFSHILAYNGTWQYYARIPTAGVWVKKLFYTNQPDNIDRLFCIMGNSINWGYFYNPLSNPLTAPTYAFVPTGHIAFPQYDGGMAEDSGGFYDWVFNADQLNGTLTKIDTYYGLNGASAVVTLGQIGTTPKILQFGNGLGVEGYKIQPYLLFTGGSQNTTPVYRNSVIHYLKEPETKETYTFTIDINETSNLAKRNPEHIIGSLDYLRNKKTKFTLQYSRVPTKAVKVLEMPSSEEFFSELGSYSADERKGFITVRVSEVI